MAMAMASPVENHKHKSEEKHKSKEAKKRKRDHDHEGDEDVNVHKSEEKHKSKEAKKRKRNHEGDEDVKVHKSKKHRSHKRRDSESKTSRREQEISAGSPFHIQTSSLYLPLAPISQRHPLEGMCAEHLSPLVLKYYPPFSGVILSYSNPRMSRKPYGDDGDHVLLQCIDEYAAAFAWVTAEFLIFKPEKGGWLEGYVIVQNEGHLGLVCWNLFNASIERQRLPKDWKWVGGHEARNGKNMISTDDSPEHAMGYFVDGDGERVEGMIRFRVKDIESSHDRERGFLSIQGTMLDDDAEKEVLEREYLLRRNGKDIAGKRINGPRALGATSLGIPAKHNGDTW